MNNLNREELFSQVRASYDGIDDFLSSVNNLTSIIIGSIAEGMASSTSDLDIFFIGHGAEEFVRQEFHFDHGTIVERNHYLAGGREVNLHAFTAPAYRELRDKMRLIGEQIASPNTITGKLPVLTALQYELLSDIRQGVVINDVEGDPGIAELRLDQLPTIVAISSLISHYASREDIIGQIQQGDYSTANWMKREAILALSSAALASVGETNPRFKWRLRKIGQHAALMGGTADRLRTLLESDGGVEIASAADFDLLCKEWDQIALATALAQPSVVGSMAHLGSVNRVTESL